SMLLIALSFAAALAADPVDNYRACIELQSPSERLSCYDRAARIDDEAMQAILERRRAEQVKAQQAQPTLTAETQALPVIGPKPSADPSGPRINPKDEPKTGPTLAVQEIRFNRNGSIIITLENGEVWAQIKSDTRKIKDYQADRIETAQVSKGALGSRKMRLEPLGRTVKVRLQSE
ncbi:MAG: hypothetical protein AAF830_00005, partial [Pseudomonadota bacterium]